MLRDLLRARGLMWVSLSAGVGQSCRPMAGAREIETVSLVHSLKLGITIAIRS